MRMDGCDLETVIVVLATQFLITMPASPSYVGMMTAPRPGQFTPEIAYFYWVIGLRHSYTHGAAEPREK